MLTTDEHQQEKQKQDQEAISKAKRREAAMRKREQASQAAKTDLRVAAPMVASDKPPIQYDNMFTARPVVTPSSGNSNPRTMVQASPLVLRRSNIPPVAGRLLSRPMAMLPARAHNLTRTQSMFNVLTGDNNTDDEEDMTPRSATIGHKRVRECELTPLANFGITGQLEHNHDNEDSISYEPIGLEDGTHDDLGTSTTDKSTNKRLRKRACRHLPSIDDDENQGVDVLDATEHSLHGTPTLSLKALAIACDSATPLNAKPTLKTEDMGNCPIQPLSTLAVNNMSKGRPKAADYDSDVRAVLDTAIELYRVILLTENPYPTNVQEVEWANLAWQLACDHHGHELICDGTILKLIMVRSTHVRGLFKSKARPIVATLFGFETSANVEVQNANRQLVSELKQHSAFIFHSRGSSLDEHAGLYNNPAIQQLINEVLFKHKSDDAIKWEKYYNPFPQAAFALALTAIECAIDEWTTGSHELIAFKEDEYKGVFQSHYASLDEFSKVAGKLDLLKKLLEQVYATGCVHASVTVTNTNSERKAIPSRAFLNAIRDYQMAEEGPLDM